MSVQRSADSAGAYPGNGSNRSNQNVDLHQVMPHPHINGQYSPPKLPHSIASGRVVSSSSHEERDGGRRGGGGEREYSEPRTESGMGEGLIVTHV